VTISISAERITLEWVAVGERAFGLVHAGRIVALVYWEHANVAELGEIGGEPTVTQSGFAWVAADAPWEHFYLFETEVPGEESWAHARDMAARAYFDVSRH
jgi:hypothetical protein